MPTAWLQTSFTSHQGPSRALSTMFVLFFAFSSSFFLSFLLCSMSNALGCDSNFSVLFLRSHGWRHRV